MRSEGEIRKGKDGEGDVESEEKRGRNKGRECEKRGNDLTNRSISTQDDHHLCSHQVIIIVIIIIIIVIIIIITETLHE